MFQIVSRHFKAFQRIAERFWRAFYNATQSVSELFSEFRRGFRDVVGCFTGFRITSRQSQGDTEHFTEIQTDVRGLA